MHLDRGGSNLEAVYSARAYLRTAIEKAPTMAAIVGGKTIIYGDVALTFISSAVFFYFFVYRCGEPGHYRITARNVIFLRRWKIITLSF